MKAKAANNMTAYCLVGTELKASGVLSHSIRRKDRYQAHFAGGATEAQKVK